MNIMFGFAFPLTPQAHARRKAKMNPDALLILVGPFKFPDGGFDQAADVALKTLVDSGRGAGHGFYLG